ncbi:putative motility protein [uncultured Roseibium sp.]|uniref:putative motility protein n=1 Tax=uncultured Roseibium sp. TaxID=1936171 RepID=UPI002599294C|nr:putative motility protein [uncultured Roseibium sp.]
MDSTGIASAYVTMTQSQTSSAIQTEIMKMSVASEANVVALLEAGAQSLEATTSTPADPAPGLGGNIDVSV